jgi:NAD(P)-dependent dehydrogenase (short-subunit alcohol dehydrogenase family)
MDLGRRPLLKLASWAIHRPTGILLRPLVSHPSLEDVVGGKVVLVTGASSGIGEAAARRLGDAGATVLLVARSREKLEQLQVGIEEAGGEAEALQCDLTDVEDIERLAANVLDRHGHVQVLVNNAGISIRRSIDLSYDRFHDFERTIQLNYLGPVRLILALLPAMRNRKSGHLVNVSSAGVPVRVPRFSAYLASKAALETFSDCIAAEIAADGVHVTSVQMPLVRTPMISPTEVYQSIPSLSADQAADRICKAIVYKPRRIGTPYGEAAALADVVSPGSLGAIRAAGYRLFPDSPAARDGGED